MKMVNVELTDPFCYERLYGNEKYSLNNMLMTQTSVLPARVEYGKAASWYSDQVSKEWDAARVGISSTANGDAWWNGVDSKQLLRFAKRIAVAFGFTHDVTVARIVRYTNAGQYPVYRLDIFSGGEGYLMNPKSKRYRGFDDHFFLEEGR